MKKPVTETNNSVLVADTGHQGSSGVDDQKRDFLKGLSLLFGGGVVAQLTVACQAIDVATSYTAKPDTLLVDGQLLGRDELLILRDICAQVIPATDTPGAVEVDCHGFIDNQLFHCHGETDQLKVRTVLASLDEQSKKRYSTGFDRCEAAQQLDLLSSLEAAENGFNDTQKWNFKFLKSLIVFGYYTSEVGASEELTYLPVPGGFKGSIPLDSVRSAWSS